MSVWMFRRRRRPFALSTVADGTSGEGVVDRNREGSWSFGSARGHRFPDRHRDGTNDTLACSCAARARARGCLSRRAACACGVEDAAQQDRRERRRRSGADRAHGLASCGSCQVARGAPHAIAPWCAAAACWNGDADFEPHSGCPQGFRHPARRGSGNALRSPCRSLSGCPPGIHRGSGTPVRSVRILA